jgi:hypothetical protein
MFTAFSNRENIAVGVESQALSCITQKRDKEIDLAFHGGPFLGPSSKPKYFIEKRKR